MKSCIKDPCVWVRKRVRPISHRRVKSFKRMNYERCTVTTGKRVRQPDEAITQLQHEPQRVRVHAIFSFYLAGKRRDRERWLYDFLMHTYTGTHRLLFVYQAGTGQNTKPALICMDIWSVCGCECVWMAELLSVHKSVWIQSSKFNIKSQFSVCIWCNAVVAVTVGLRWGIQFPLFKFNLCAAFW